MISCLGNYLERKFLRLPAGVDVQPFLDLLVLVVEHPSLVVSIPVLVTWMRLLSNGPIGTYIASTPLVGPLLEVCSSRLLRYENLPEDTRDPSYVLLLEDTDTLPERHAFLGNYRRYSAQIIESIVQLKLVDAFRHILGQAEAVLQRLDEGQPTFDGEPSSPASKGGCTLSAFLVLTAVPSSGEIRQELDVRFAS